MFFAETKEKVIQHGSMCYTVCVIVYIAAVHTLVTSFKHNVSIFFKEVKSCFLKQLTRHVKALFTSVLYLLSICHFCVLWFWFIAK